MRIEIRMPQLGMMMVEGTVLRWLVADGAPVEDGDDVLEIESDKVIQTITAPAAGTVMQAATPGQCVPVLQAVGYIVTGAGTSVAPLGPARDPGAAATLPQIETPAARAGDEVRASPIARRLAVEHGLDLGAIAGTGPGGRVVEADVQAIIEHARDHATGGRVRQRIPLAGRRGVIARRMMASLQQTAQLTITREIEVSALVAMRAAWLARADALDAALRYDAILAKVLADALAGFPTLNAVIDGDEIVVLADVHVGVAMATSGGLVVPVVQHADQRSLIDIARTIDAFALRARDDRLTAEDLADGTVTLTNMGMYGVDGFTPVLNPPESAILGAGCIAQRPWVSGDELCVRPTLHLSLTWDHRVADGAEAGALMSRIALLAQDEGYLAGLTAPG